MRNVHYICKNSKEHLNYNIGHHKSLAVVHFQDSIRQATMQIVEFRQKKSSSA
jgi:hypothetical protein